ncbi:MAG TPA: TolC family protein, partial [Alicycliphilus sp.]|nr:TolC family protein [Alicycliphilus sp.]
MSVTPPSSPHSSGPRALAWAPLLAVLVLSGCASTRAPDPPGSTVPVPATWSGQDAAQPAPTGAALAQWWQQLGDARLTQLIEQALQAHTSVRSARAAVEQARAQRDIQAAGLLPSLDASGSAQRSRSQGSTGNSFQLGLDASWEADLFGRIASGVRAGDADLLAAEAGVAAALVALAGEVAVNYINLRGQQLRLSIAESNLASQRETAQITQWRVQAGLANSVAEQQARTIVEQTAAQLPTLQAAIAQSRHALAVLTNQPPAALDEILAAAAPVPLPPSTLALAFPADTLRQRPDVRQAELRVRAA